MLFVLAGCGTQAQFEAIKITSTAGDVYKKVLACSAEVEVIPRYARIYEKLGVATASDPQRMPSQAQLIDQERISDDDLALALSWYASSQHCAVEAMEPFYDVAPEFQAYFADSQREITDIINEAVTTKPSYARINERILNLKLRQKETAKLTVQEIRKRLIAQNAQELQDQQEVAQQVVEIALNAALSLASRQAVLVRSQRAFLIAHAHYEKIDKIKTIKCNSVGHKISCALV